MSTGVDISQAMVGGGRGGVGGVSCECQLIRKRVRPGQALRDTCLENVSRNVERDVLVSHSEMELDQVTAEADGSVKLGISGTT